METFNVKVEFIDGTSVIIAVEAENEDDALNKAMPISLSV